MSTIKLHSENPVSSEEPATPLRFVTAASLFDGHDASINIMRRILQSLGVEVIHLAHNRSVAEVVQAALQEDVHGIAMSSYQGGHVEYFKYMVDMLKENNAEHIRVFGGGGGVIVPSEIKELHAYGVERIYSPQDGMKLGLVGMIQDMVNRCSAHNHSEAGAADWLQDSSDYRALSKLITAIESSQVDGASLAKLQLASSSKAPVLGITGTGGAGKSSLTDEMIRRFRLDSNDDARIAVLAIDPTRRKTGGALLGDRIRMNSIYQKNVFMRSIATRGSVGEVPAYLSEIIAAVRHFDFDLVVVETPGIGQGDAGIVPYVDASMYVMTPEFGAQSQLEKIDMLDFADIVVINKFDRKGAADALRDVAKQVQRNREAWDSAPSDLPVFGSIASRFGDDGVTSAYHGLLSVLRDRGLREWESRLAFIDAKIPSERSVIVPSSRQRYLAEISETVRGYLAEADVQATIASERQSLRKAQQLLGSESDEFLILIEQRDDKLTNENKRLLSEWESVKAGYQGVTRVDTLPNGKEVTTELVRESLSGTLVPRVALPKFSDHGDLLRWMKRENLPGIYPYT